MALRDIPIAIGGVVSERALSEGTRQLSCAPVWRTQRDADCYGAKLCPISHLTAHGRFDAYKEASRHVRNIFSLHFTD